MHILGYLPKLFLGYLFVVISALGFGISSILVKLAYNYQVTPVQLLTIQNLFATLILWLLAVIFYPSALKINKKQLSQLLVQGLLGNLLSSLLLFLALQRIPASIVITLFFTYPAFVNILAYVFFQEKITSYRWFSLVLTFLGIILTINIFQCSLEKLTLPGILYSLAAALASAFFSLYSQRVLKSIRTLTTTIYPISFATLLLCLVSPPLYLFRGQIGWQVILLALALSTVSTIIPLFSLFKGISLIGASHSAIVSTTELPFALFLAYLVLGERILWLQLLGALFIVISLVILSQESK